MFYDELGRREDILMKPMLYFSSLVVCLIFLFLMVPIAGAQEEDAANNQEPSQEDKIEAEKERL